METFEFIIGAYGRPNELMMEINSIYAQKAKNWKIHVISDGDYDGFDRVKKYFEGDDKIKFSTVYGPNGRYNDWGFSPRQYGIDQSTADWIIMTGDDNYYFPVFLDNFNACVDGETNFIFCNMMHNYSNYVPEKTELRKVIYPDGFFRYEGIDIGCFASRAKYAKQIEIQKHLHWADGQYVADYWEKFCKEPKSIKKIDQVFYVHN